MRLLFHKYLSSIRDLSKVSGPVDENTRATTYIGSVQHGEIHHTVEVQAFALILPNNCTDYSLSKLLRQEPLATTNALYEEASAQYKNKKKPVGGVRCVRDDCIHTLPVATCCVRERVRRRRQVIES